MLDDLAWHPLDGGGTPQAPPRSRGRTDGNVIPLFPDPLIIHHPPSLRSRQPKKIRKAARKALKEHIDYDDVIRHMPTRSIAFEFAAKELTKPIRNTYGQRDFRQLFLQAAHEEMCMRWHNVLSEKRLAAAVEDYNIHHKLPIWLGGTNDFENLILIDRKLHDRIHKKIARTLSQIQSVQDHHKRARKKPFRTLEEDLLDIKGVTLGEDGKIFMRIPYPEGKIIIPQLFMHELGSKRLPPDEARAKLADKWPTPTHPSPSPKSPSLGNASPASRHG